MAPEAKSEDLLYVSDDSGFIYVFSYPEGKLVGTLAGAYGPSGLCSDKAGHVFVANTQDANILEYAHGGKNPIATLADPGYYPNGCAVDPTTGNLAVANYASTLIGPGSVSVYSNGRPPVTYTDPVFNEYLFCGYDDKGNLYVDGVNAGTTQTELAKLPSGKTSFTNIRLKQRIGFPGAVQWDGTYVAIEDATTNIVYRLKVSGSAGAVVGEIRFKGPRSNLLVQFWIQGNAIIVPYGSQSRTVRMIGLWRYPAGGSPTKVLRDPAATELFGATVSLAK
jgi:hypothetical protein